MLQIRGKQLLILKFMKDFVLLSSLKHKTGLHLLLRTSAIDPEMNESFPKIFVLGSEWTWSHVAEIVAADAGDWGLCLKGTEFNMKAISSIYKNFLCQHS